MSFDDRVMKCFERALLTNPIANTHWCSLASKYGRKLEICYTAEDSPSDCGFMDSCITCPFCKDFDTYVKQVRTLKMEYILIKSMPEMANQAKNKYKISYFTTTVKNLLYEFNRVVRKVCYITFSDEDFRNTSNAIRNLSFDELGDMLIKFDAACKERNL